MEGTGEGGSKNGAKGDLLLSDWCRSSDHSVRVEAGSGETKPGRD